MHFYEWKKGLTMGMYYLPGGVGYSVPWYTIDGSWVRYFVIGGMPGRAEAGGRSCQYLFRENEMNEEHQLCGF